MTSCATSPAAGRSPPLVENRLRRCQRDEIRRAGPGRLSSTWVSRRLPRRHALLKQIQTAHEPPPFPHPSMADLYRTKVEQLADALQRDHSRIEASDTLRGLIDSIVLPPEGQPPSRDGDEPRSGEPRLRIELRDNLAAMLAAAEKTKRSPETGDLFVPVQLVAGACNRRYLQLWSGAA